MDLCVDSLWTRGEVLTDDERSWLATFLSFDEERFVRGKHISPRVHRLFNALSDAFPSGMVPHVEVAAEEAGFAVRVVDTRHAPLVPSAAEQRAAATWLRDYQATAVERVFARTRGILWMPTGSGKTEVAIALAAATPDARWLFLVHRAGLLEQAAARFEARTGETAGRIGDGRYEIGRFTVATFQTVARLRERNGADDLLNVDGLIVDECHVVPASQAWSIAMSCPAFWRVGMSGTPLSRGDKRSILSVAALGPVIYRLRADKLVDAGVLARPTIRMLPVYQESTKATFQGVYGDLVVRGKARNAAVVDACVRAEKPCLLFVKELRHGRELLARLGKAGLRADFAHGSHSTEWRTSSIGQLVRDQLDVLISSVVMQEGVDIPSLASVVIGSGGRSVIATLQRIGRGMRSDGGRKSTFEVWDFDDRGHRWTERHAKERRRAYEGEGFTVVIEDANGAQTALAL